MGTRLLLAAFCILALPLWFSSASDKTTTKSSQFTMIALAGHINPSGAYCECETQDCTGGPGEMSIRNQPASDKPYKNTLSGAGVATGFDPVAGLLLVTLLIMLGLRMRL